MSQNAGLLETLEAVTEITIALCDDHKLHCVSHFPPRIDPKIFGTYGFRSGRRHAPKDRYFYMTVAGQVVADRQFKEIDIIVGLGEKLERHYTTDEDEYQVIDIRLPKAHGYSGIKYGYRRTRELFPHAGLPKRKRKVKDKKEETA